MLKTIFSSKLTFAVSVCDQQILVDVVNGPFDFTVLHKIAQHCIRLHNMGQYTSSAQKYIAVKNIVQVYHIPESDSDFYLIPLFFT